MRRSSYRQARGGSVNQPDTPTPEERLAKFDVEKLLLEKELELIELRRTLELARQVPPPSQIIIYPPAPICPPYPPTDNTPWIKWGPYDRTTTGGMPPPLTWGARNPGSGAE